MVAWVYMGVSLISILFYLIYGSMHGVIDIGVMICVLIVAVPIQFFLHLYFASTIKSGNFSGFAGFDSGVEYNIPEAKKLLIKIDHHIGMSSAAYVMISCLLASGIAGEVSWTGYLIFIYTIEFIAAILLLNYQAMDRLYKKEEDLARARGLLPVTYGYLGIALASVAAIMIVFSVKGISNNTLPALKLGAVMVVGILTATAGMLREDFVVKKWNPSEGRYRMSRFCKISYGIAVFSIILLFFI